MSEVFFIADLHLGHKGIITFDATKPFRPFATIEEHDAELVRRWNAVVGKNDSVWVLGDFCFGKHSLAIAGELNGTKRLVMGNHDMYPAADYLRYFTRLCGVVEFKGAVLSHVPVHPSQLDRWRFNVHGHLHTKAIDDPRYFCVSAERQNLTPISWDEVLRKREGL
ncbi:MAG: metallophosphoesterase [Acetobacteraceae bacterium]